MSSATGRRPAVAAPIAAPMNADSEIGVSDPAGELVVQPLGHAEHAAPGILRAGRSGAPGVVLAHDDDAFVALHFLGQRLVQGFAVGDVAGHGPSDQ